MTENSATEAMAEPVEILHRFEARDWITVCRHCRTPNLEGARFHGRWVQDGSDYESGVQICTWKCGHEIPFATLVGTCPACTPPTDEAPF